MTPREIAYSTFEFRNTGRAPREICLLPWAYHHYKKEVERFLKDFPSDFAGIPLCFKRKPIGSGDMF